MRLDLVSATDRSAHALFDPGALLDFLNHPARARDLATAEAMLLDELAAGRWACYSSGADGHARFALFVDQEIPGELLAHREGPWAEGVLHLPTGRLWAAGVEHLLSARGQAYTAESFHPLPLDMGSLVFVPPGSYRVKAFRVGQPERAPYRADRRLGGLTCLAVPLSLALLLAGGVALEPPRSSMLYLAVALAWAILVALWRRPDRLRRIETERVFHETAGCDAVVALGTGLDRGPKREGGLAFGPGRGRAGERPALL